MSGKMLIYQRLMDKSPDEREENDYKINVLLFSITYVKKIKADANGQLL